MRSVASPPVSLQTELLHWAFGLPPSASPSVPLATVPSAGEPRPQGAGSGNGRHDEGPAKWTCHHIGSCSGAWQIEGAR